MFISSLRSCALAALIALSLAASSAHGAFITRWQAGVDNNSNSDFGQENGSLNSAPGSATTRDDDWYLAGDYPAPIGTLASDEALLNFERALTIADHTNRIHFNLSAAELVEGREFRLLIDNISNSITSGTIAFSVLFNDVNVFNGTVTTTGGGLFTTPAFLATAVNAVEGENVVTLTRTTTGGSWMQFDYVRLETQVPEPGIALAVTALLVITPLRRRRRMSQSLQQ